LPISLPDQLLVPAPPARFARNCGVGAWPFSLFGRRLCPYLFVTCLLGEKCIYTTMSEGSGRSGGRRPNRGGGQSRGKRPMYEDLDALQSTDWLTLSDSGTGSGSGDLSSSQKRSKRTDAMRRTQVIHRGGTRRLQDR
jgi:hypothetical protein